MTSQGTIRQTALMAAVIALSLGTAASFVVPGLHASVVAPVLDTVLDTLATFVTLAVAVLAWLGFRQRGDPSRAFQAAAFSVLAIGSGFGVVAVTTGLDARVGMALASPGQTPIYVFTLASVFAATRRHGQSDWLPMMRPTRGVVMLPYLEMGRESAMKEAAQYRGEKC